MVHHFGMWKGLRPGLEESMSAIRNEMDTVSGRLKELSTDHMKRTKESATTEKDEARQQASSKEADKLSEDWKRTLDRIATVQDVLKRLEERYAWTPEERAAAERYVQAKLAELTIGSPQPESKKPSEKAGAPSKTESSKKPEVQDKTKK
jgi:hypothetical protein